MSKDRFPCGDEVEDVTSTMSTATERKPMISDADAVSLAMNGSHLYGEFITPRSMALIVRDYYEHLIDKGVLIVAGDMNDEVRPNRLVELPRRESDPPFWGG